MVNLTIGQIETLLQELRVYIKMTEEEQRDEIYNRLPTPDEYLHRRMGTSAVAPLVALHE